MSPPDNNIQARDRVHARAAVPSRIVVQSARVLGILSLAICSFMFVGHFRANTQDPFRSAELAGLKLKLLEAPKDEQLKEQIRTLDLRLRRQYFRQLSVNRSGAWLTLGTLALFLLAARKAAANRQRPPMPQPRLNLPEQVARTNVWSRWSVGALGAVSVLAFVGAALTSSTALPSNPETLQKLLRAGTPGGSPAVTDFAPPDEMSRNWARFRGPLGNGVSTDTNAPLVWDRKSGTGIAWTAEVPVSGFNSPIVWSERVFVAGGDAARREVLCYSAADGQLLWRRPLELASAAPAPKREIPEETGYSASTMATDGRRVYAIFANGDLAAFNLDGQPVWAKNLGFPKNQHGHASSLLAWEGKLIVQLDQGEAEQNLSRISAIDGASGRILWQRSRPVSTSWATPIVIQAAGQTQIITLSVPWVIAYAAGDGAELWRVEGLNGEVTPSPIFAAGLVLAISPHEKMMAIRPDGRGDVTKSHVSWEAEENIPDIVSPVSNGELVFTLTTPGMLTCYDAKEGKKQWEQDLGMDCQASPTLVGDRLYIVASTGVGLVLEAGRAFRELRRNSLEEKVYASPAFMPGRIYMRGVAHLFCITGQQGTLARGD